MLDFYPQNDASLIVIETARTEHPEINMNLGIINCQPDHQEINVPINLGLMISKV
jgi:hypothetical protein